MLHPFTIPAKYTSLNQQERLTCMCGKQIRVGDGLACYTHPTGSEEYGYYIACSPTCLIVHVSAGSA
jgi:hypothetical protein